METAAVELVEHVSEVRRLSKCKGLAHYRVQRQSEVPLFPHQQLLAVVAKRRSVGVVGVHVLAPAAVLAVAFLLKFVAALALVVQVYVRFPLQLVLTMGILTLC